MDTHKKLKQIRAGGKWPTVREKSGAKKRVNLGKEIREFYERQQQDKEREAGGESAQPL